LEKTKQKNNEMIIKMPKKTKQKKTEWTTPIIINFSFWQFANDKWHEYFANRDNIPP